MRNLTINIKQLEQSFGKLASEVEFCTLRVVREHSERIVVRRDIVQPLGRSNDVGAMLTVFDKGGLGYAATPDLSANGLSQALQNARAWAHASALDGLIDQAAFAKLQDNIQSGDYHSSVEQAWTQLSLADKLDLLKQQCSRLKIDDRIIDWQASLAYRCCESWLLSSTGACIEQRLETILPGLAASAYRKGESQRRTFGGDAHLRQSGLEVLQDSGFEQAAPLIAQQALELLAAPDCPSADLDLLLAPDQMILQIHESIGHPLELDRILGDERNYAGTSFVSPDMFGTFQYGSKQLNVTFDPTLEKEAASYAFDDEGSAASKAYLIKDGVLLRPLGGALSQSRANLPGVANTRACSWNRPPIDRMANLNIEPGDAGFADMVASVERGVYMQTNRSWSIDDSRNKFQFGCEYAQLIENGELTQVVKNPNYRGISSQFWGSLDKVGDASTVELMAAEYCGKGEPNQAIHVGHASPPCLFRDVAVFGGA